MRVGEVCPGRLDRGVPAVSYRRRAIEKEAPGGAGRVLVYGVTGSGKTTAAARIGAATGIAWTSVDDLTWEADWVAVSEDEQRRRIQAICAQGTWLLDTAYGTWLDVPLARGR